MNPTHQSITPDVDRRPRRRRFRFGHQLGAFGLTAALAIGGGGALLQQCAPAPAPAPAPSGVKPVTATAGTNVINIVNQERTARGLRPLAWNGHLTTAAQNHSNDMAARRTMTHTGANGSNAGQRIAATGYRARAWGENVAAGYNTAPSVMQGWMNSAGHRTNILSTSFTEIGVAASVGPNGVKYWTMVLAAR